MVFSLFTFLRGTKAESDISTKQQRESSKELLNDYIEKSFKFLRSHNLYKNTFSRQTLLIVK